MVVQTRASTAGGSVRSVSSLPPKMNRKRNRNPPPQQKPPTEARPREKELGLEEPITETRQEEEEFLGVEEPIEKFLEALAKKTLVALVKEAISKYGEPDYIQSIRNVADVDPALRKIRVRVYGKACLDDETLTSVYGKYGEIENYCFLNGQWILFGCSRVSATVDILFKHRYGARKVLKLPYVPIGKDAFATSGLQSLICQTNPLRFTPNYRFIGSARSLLEVEEPGEKLIDFFGKDHLVELVLKAISRHPDFIKSVKNQASLDPTPRRVQLFCEKLPEVLGALTSFYGKYGEIEECTATVGCVNILYKHRYSACEALKYRTPEITMHLLPWCQPGPEEVGPQMWKSTGYGWSPIPRR